MSAARTHLLASVVSGAVSGIVVAVLVSAPKPEPATPTQGAEASTRSESSPERALPRVNRFRLGNLEQRVDGLADALEAKQPPAAGTENPGQSSVQAPDGESDPELGRAAELAWWDETLEAFEEERTDPTWAVRTAETFDSDLEDLSEAEGYTTISTECRSTKCRATIEWPSYEAAVTGYAALLHHDYLTNCARRTLLPEPSKERLGEPYQMTVVFDCGETVDNG